MAIPSADLNTQPHYLAHRHSIRIQRLTLGIALMLLAGLMIHQSVSTYRNITDQEQHRLQTQVEVIAANVERQLKATSLALGSIIDNLPQQQPNQANQDTNRLLLALADAMPGIRTILVLNADGVVVASNRDNLIGVDSNQREYFFTPKNNPDPAALFLSPPFKTRLGNYLFTISRTISSSDGSFAGVVSAAIDPEYFQVLLDSVLYAPDMSCAILHGDGALFMRVPQKQEAAEQNLSLPANEASPILTSDRQDGLSTYTPPGSDAKRILEWRTVQPRQPLMDKPLFVSCSRDLAAIYLPWRDTTVRMTISFALICTVSGVGLGSLQRRQHTLALQRAQTQELLNLRLSLMEYAASHNLQELLSRSLDEVCRLCNSPIGFFHLVEADQETILLQAWSTKTLRDFCTIEGHGQHYPLEQAGIWADCIRQQRPVIHNDYLSLATRKGLPAGHAPVIRELVAPIFRNGRVVAVLGVGNKPQDYDQQDVELVTHLADIAWDITERRQAEEERYKLGVRYRTLQSISRDGIHILDLKGNLVESNAAFRQMLGYDETEPLSLHVSDWDIAVSPEAFPQRINTMIQTPAVFETRHRRKDGTVFDAEISVCGVQLEGEWLLYCSSRDISQRKEMELSLRESHQRLADIFDFLPDATFVVDNEKKVIAWNKAMEQMSGVPKKAMLGRGDNAYAVPFYGEPRGQLLDLLDIDDKELEAKYQGVARQGERLFAEAFCPALRNGKGAHVWAVVAPLYDGDRRRIGSIESVRDITSIKETEAELARSNQDLEEFAYVASHDLQEPLRKIAGFTELLANRYRGALDEKAESYMEYIIDGATRMRSLINDLLSYSRVMRTTGELAEVNCNDIVSRILRDMDLAIRECAAEISCGPLPVVAGDKTQLGQLFQNLIGNAIKYRGAAPPKIVVEARQQASEWLFSVADNGIGIVPEFFQRIFVLFQRLHTRTEYPGTGIGLALSQKIVERHGGSIWVESTEGVGSTFFFTLPLQPQNPESAP